MKRIIRILCIASLSLTFVSAQPPEDGHIEYLRWKEQISTTLQNYNHLYSFQVAIALKRTDETHIKILLTVVGRTPNYSFTQQPVHALQFFDADADTDKTGEPTEWSAAQDTTVPRLGYLLDFDETIECEQNTNAVLVSIRPVPNTGQPVETTVLRMVVPLDDKWHFEKRDFFVPRAQKLTAVS